MASLVENTILPPTVVRGGGYWSGVFRRLRRDPVAVAAGLVILAIVARRHPGALHRARRSLPGVEPAAAAADRHPGIPARHRRARARHALAPHLRRPPVAVHGRDAGADRLLHRLRHRHPRRLCRRAAQHARHAHHRRVLRLPVGAARRRSVGRPRGGLRQRPPVADDRLHPADRPRRRGGDDADPLARLRRGGARLRRLRPDHHPRAYPRQRARPDLRLRDEPDLRLDDPRLRACPSSASACGRRSPNGGSC